MVNYYVILTLLTVLFILFKKYHFQLSTSSTTLPETVKQDLIELHLGFSERPVSITEIRQVDDTTYLFDLYNEWGKRQLRATDVMVTELATAVPRFSVRPANAEGDASFTVLNDVTGEPIMLEESFHERYLVFSPTPEEASAFLNPALREALLAEENLVIEAGGNYLSVDMLGESTAASKRSVVRRLVEAFEKRKA